jgi:hypothetical protein
MIQFGGSPIKVGEEEFSIFRDHEYVAMSWLTSFTYSANTMQYLG